MKRTLSLIGWALAEIILFVVIYAIALAIQLGCLYLMGLHPLDYFTLSSISEQTNPYPLLALNYFPQLLAFCAASIVVHYIIFSRPLDGLGYQTYHAAGFFGKGWLWSMVMIVPGFLLLLTLHQIQLLPSSHHYIYVIGFLIFFFVQSAGEEILTRGFLIPMLENRLGTVVALIFSASIFAFMHIANDNFTWLGFTNILLGGFIMALFFILYRNIWICVGYHAGWNFMQAGFFDFNVSGVDVHSLIQWQDIGYPRITGAAFGYEGSLIAVVFQTMLLMYIIKTNTIKWVGAAPGDLPTTSSIQLEPIISESNMVSENTTGQASLPESPN